MFLAVLADRCFGFSLGARQWWGVGLTAAGLAFLGLTADAGGDEHSKYSLAAMIAFEGGMIGIGVAPDALRTGLSSCASVTASSSGPRRASCSESPTSRSRRSRVTCSPTPWRSSRRGRSWRLVASVAAFYASARGLQLGEGVSVIAVTAVAANGSAILGGIIVFGDPLGSDALAIIARSAAFALVLAAAALMPAPLRAASRQAA